MSLDVESIYNDLIQDDTYWTNNPGRKIDVQREVSAVLRDRQVKTVLESRGFEVQACDLADATKFLKDIPFKECALTEMPYEDNSFDAVACVDVIEHLYESDVKDAIKEMLRVGKELFIRIACYESHHGKYGRLHLTLNKPSWWKETVSECGKIVWSKYEQKNGRKDRDICSFLVRRRGADENRVLSK